MVKRQRSTSQAVHQNFGRLHVFLPLPSQSLRYGSTSPRHFGDHLIVKDDRLYLRDGFGRRLLWAGRKILCTDSPFVSFSGSRTRWRAQSTLSATPDAPKIYKKVCGSRKLCAAAGFRPSMSIRCCIGWSALSGTELLMRAAVSTAYIKIVFLTTVVTETTTRHLASPCFGLCTVASDSTELVSSRVA